MTNNISHCYSLHRVSHLELRRYLSGKIPIRNFWKFGNMAMSLERTQLKYPELSRKSKCYFKWNNLYILHFWIPRKILGSPYDYQLWFFFLRKKITVCFSTLLSVFQNYSWKRIDDPTRLRKDCSVLIREREGFFFLFLQCVGSD